MGIGKFHNEKPFPESESQWRDSWLSWDGRRKGRSNGANGYVCFCQQRAPRTKQVLCDTPGLLCSPIGTRQHPVESPHVCLLYLVQINCSVTCWDCSAPQQALGSMQWSQPMPVFLYLVLSVATFSDVLSHAEVRFSKCSSNNCYLISF